MSIALPSLLDALEARDRKAGRESVTHLCYVASTMANEEALRWHDVYMAGIARGGNVGPATGIMLVHAGIMLHYVEAPASVCVSLLRAAQAQGRAKPTFGPVRISVCCLASNTECNMHMHLGLTTVIFPRTFEPPSHLRRSSYRMSTESTSSKPRIFPLPAVDLGSGISVVRGL